MAKNNIKPKASKEEIEYEMSKEMAKKILATRKGNEQPQDYLCRVVNEEFGIKGNCVRVIAV